MAGGSGKAGRSGRWRSGVILRARCVFCEEPYRADELLDLRGERLAAGGSERVGSERESDARGRESVELGGSGPGLSTSCGTSCMSPTAGQTLMRRGRQ